MRNIILISFLFVSSLISAQTVNINGVAPAYLDKKVEVFRIQDYLSMRQELIASTKVGIDSTFSLSFKIDDIQKVIIKSDNNRGFLYVEPSGEYTVFFPERNIYEPKIASGNDVELGFYNLDSTDINYKILGFQRWMDHFIGRTYHARNSTDNTEYIESFERFKTNVEKAYAADTSSNSSFLKTHIKFSIASLENINNIAERNRYEKHDFFIKFNPVEYNNDVYMEYIHKFYEKLTPQLSNETNEAYYKGVLNSSPSMIMNAFGREYTLINRRIREIVMIQALSEAYYTDDYPQTNIITILDSVAEHSLFEANGQIAANVRFRLMNLVPGSKAPNFALLGDSLETKTLIGLQGKHLYLHFFNPTIPSNMKELELVEGLNAKYGEYVNIISIYNSDVELTEALAHKLSRTKLDIYPISSSNSIWKKYQVEVTPHYTLIDATGYIIQSPALGPTPNGQYETIERTFFQLRKILELQNNEGGQLFGPKN